MKKIRQYLSIFLTLAVTLTCFADTSVYAQTGEPLGQAAESDSGTVRELPIDRSFKVPVTEGLLSDNISKYAYEKWTHCITSYIEETEEGGCRRIEAADDKVYIETYSADYKLLSTKTIDFELKKFGGYYKGEDARYIVYGQPNYGEEDTKEVVRVVKYDNDWNKLGQCSITAGNSTLGVYDPFEFGAVRMTENEGILYIHTSRLLYWDAVNDPTPIHHQANITYVVDEESMECVMNAAGGDYVSHSLDQYILTDGETVYRLDLGDGAPRAVVLANNPVYKKSEGEDPWWSSNDRIWLMQMIGGYGVNYTGVSLGGFELMGDTLLVIGNSVVQDATVTNASDETTHRNIFVITQNKKWETGTHFKFLTDYTEEDGITVRTPHIVKVADGYYILWEEIHTERESEVYTTRVAKMTPDGTIEGKIHRIKARLSDCKPIVTSDNRLLWYVTANNKSLSFYSLDLNRLDDYEYSGPIYAEDFDIRLSQYTFKCVNSTHMQPYTPKVSVYYKGKELVYGEDYTFDFRDYYTEGTAYVDVTGKDYFVGSKTVTYTILPAEEDPPYQEPSWWGNGGSSQNNNKTGSSTSNNNRTGSSTSNNNKTGSSSGTGKYSSILNNNKTGNTSGTGKNTTSSTEAVQKPGKVTGVKVYNSWGKKLRVSWNSKQKISGYQIQYARNKKFTKGKKTVNVSKSSTLRIIKGLKKKTYYVRMRAYAASGNSRLYGAWSKAVKVKVKI